MENTHPRHLAPFGRPAPDAIASRRAIWNPVRCGEVARPHSTGASPFPRQRIPLKRFSNWEGSMHVRRLVPLFLLISNIAVAQSLGPPPEAQVRGPAAAFSNGSGPFWTDADGCPFPDLFATAEQLFHRRFQALVDGDIHALGCMYAKNATVIMPGAVVKGRAAVVEAFSSFGSLFGGAAPELTSVTWDGITVLATFSIAGPLLSVPDGADTFVIVGGQVVYQTVHATLVPTGATP